MHVIASRRYKATMRGVAGGHECLISLAAQRVSKSLIFEMAIWDSSRWSYVRLTDGSGVSELLNVFDIPSGATT